MGARWVFPENDERVISQMVQAHGFPEIVARLLATRRVALDDVDSFLYPRLGQHFPDPFSIKGMAEMAEDLAEAVINGRHIGVLADFDVDGATSSAVFVKFFRYLGMDVPVYIPDRLEEGYGPSNKALDTLKEQGASYVLIADCGTTSLDVIAYGKSIGLDIAVFDHHESEDTLPEANHIINPKRSDDESGLSALAAVGVCFLSCVAMNTKLREKGFFTARGIDEAPLKEWLDLVALGTICDMVPLKGANRLLVRYGFLQMAKQQNPGIAALCAVAGVHTAPTPYHAGFVLGPRINAGSRVHKSDLGARLLSAQEYETAKNIAFELEDANKKRKTIQDEMMKEAVARVEADKLAENPFIFVGDENWHAGLSGLVAGQLKERYGRPCCVVTYARGANGKLEGRGSGRSVPGVNMAAAFMAAKEEGLLIKGGGHAMAGGFTVEPDKVDSLGVFLNQHIQAQLNGKDVKIEKLMDGVLTVRGVQTEFAKLVQDNVGPFGTDNPEPLFVLPHVKLQSVDILGGSHVRCIVSDWEGGSRVKAMAFRAKDTPLGDMLLNEQKKGMAVHIAAHIKINEWQGRESAELHIQDAAIASKK